MDESLKVERLLKIDLFDCNYIASTDNCYYMFGYIVGQKPPYSPGNQLIRNFKKEVAKKNKPTEWRHKEAAIITVANLISKHLKLKNPDNAVFVPIPPSKSKDSAEYDDRLVQALIKVKEQIGIDYQDVLSMRQSLIPAHLSSENRSPEKYIENIEVDSRVNLDGKLIIIFDDVITSGAHFKACQTVLKKQYPNAKIYGLFLGRSIHVQV